jgi:hypothetical protein
MRTVNRHPDGYRHAVTPLIGVTVGDADGERGWLKSIRELNSITGWWESPDPAEGLQLESRDLGRCVCV